MQELLELRRAQWKPRRKKETPSTIQAVHAAAPHQQRRPAVTERKQKRPDGHWDTNVRPGRKDSAVLRESWRHELPDQRSRCHGTHWSPPAHSGCPVRCGGPALPHSTA